MNGEFHIGGKKYISAKRASKLTGYAMDYIGQLARAGKLDCQMIGRSWFVAEGSLLGYKHAVTDALSFKARKKKKIRAAKNTEKAISTAELGEQISDLLSVAPVGLLEKTDDLQNSEPSELYDEAPSLGETVRVVEVAPDWNIIDPDVQFVYFLNDPDEWKRSHSSSPDYSELLLVPHSPRREQASPYNNKIFHAAGNLFLSASFAIALISLHTTGTVSDILAHVMTPNILERTAMTSTNAVNDFVLSIGTSYEEAEAGAQAVGNKIAGASDNVRNIAVRGSKYLDAGLAAAGRSVASVPYHSTAVASAPTQLSDSSEPSFFAKLRSACMAKIGSAALAVHAGINNVFEIFAGEATPTATVTIVRNDDTDVSYAPVTQTASIDDEISPSVLSANTDAEPEASRNEAQGLVVMPSTNDDALDEKMLSYIRDSFSDEVEIVANDDGTGVIKPVFKSGKDEDYVYVLVPIDDGAP